MNGMFNNNFLIGMLLARDLPRQEQFFAGLVAGQMPPDSPIGPLLLQPLVSRLASEERGRATAESNAVRLQQRLEIELPAATGSAQLRVPDATASFSRVDGSPGTTFDTTTGVVTLPSVNGEEKISIAVDGTAREVTILRGPRTGTKATAAGRTLTEAELADIGRVLLAAVQRAAGSTGASLGTDAPAPNVERPGIADRPSKPAPAQQTKDRAAASRGGEGYTPPATGGKSPSAT